MSKLIFIAAIAQIAVATSPLVLAADTSHYSPTAVVQAENPKLLLQQGWKLYQTEKFSQAVQVFQQAAATFKTQGDVLNQALALNYVALTYQHLGKLSPASQAITDSLTILPKNASTSKEYLSVRAQALNTQGQIQLAQGQSQKALSSWDEAATLYAKNHDSAGEVGSKINQSQALQALGLYRRAFITLTQVNQLLQQQADPTLKATGLLSLGNALRVVGILDQQNLKIRLKAKGTTEGLGSRQVLEQSLAAASQQNSPQLLAEIYLSLGNTSQALRNTDEALQYYQKAASVSDSPLTRVEAQMNQLRLLVEAGKQSDSQALVPAIQSQLATLPLSRKTIFARINFAQSLACLKQGTEAKTIAINLTCPKQQIEAKDVKANDTPEWSAIAQIVATAVEQAKQLGDQRAEAYALGTLGGVYEQTGQLSIAQKLTQQALALTESIEAPDIGYRWQWQLGRILKAQGNQPGAIAAYSKAVDNLKSLRRDLVAANRNVQFSFRDGVEPIYRELVSLLLPPAGKQPNQEDLKHARDVIESLKVAELDNFFRRACIDAKPVNIDEVDRTAAVIYPVILSNRLAVILSLPSSSPKQKQNFSLKTIDLPQNQVEDKVEELREKLETRTTPEFLKPSQDLYNWIIRPIAPELESQKIKNLVFVLDGSLGSIPMGALYDGKQYLVEKYDVVITPGLQLLNPQPLARTELRTIAGGLTEGKQDFSPLPAVKKELQGIKSTIPSTRVLLDEKFTTAAIEDAVKSLSTPVVHLATHGQFSSTSEDTFIVTHDGSVNVNELNSLLKTRETNQRGAIELLVLSACSTATGDKKAALGIAGVAVLSGARSTLASLWVVDDEATAIIMSEFYKQLKQPKTTKVEAFRRAQLTLLKDPRYQQYRHPYYWSPFVLVGNWL